MANIENLIPFNQMSQSERSEIARKGAIASNKVQKAKKTMRQELELLLEAEAKNGKTYQENITIALMGKAIKGDTKAYEIIRDTAGQNPDKVKEEVEKVEQIIQIPAKDIAKSFVDINRSIDDREYREYFLEGGRGSTKSSFISEKVIELMENNPKMCCVVLRKVKDTLKDSVFAQLEWAIDTLAETYPSIKEDYKLTKSPMEITKLSTGQKIFFRGADDYGKIKSLKTPKDMYVGITWYEEFDQFAGMLEVRKINQSLIRGGDDYIQFYSYNTPPSKQHFVNIEKRIPKPSRLVNLSDYRDVPKKWLGQAFIDEAEFLKETNEKAYENEYLGIETGIGGNVFENLEIREITNEEIETYDYIYMGLDFGWYPDPLAWTKMCYNPAQRALYIFDEFLVNKMSNADVWDYLVQNKGVTTDDMIIADSAEPKSIGDFKSYGALIKGAEKGPESVKYSMKWLSSLAKIVIDPVRCPKTMQEFSNYEYEQDKDGNWISGYPDENNHTIDSVRYALNKIWKKKGE